MACTGAMSLTKREIMSMQGKRLGFLCVMLAIMVGMTCEVFGQDSESEMCVPMGVITIKPPPDVTPQKSPVDFPHSRHFATDCRTCHHTWKGEENIQGCQTSGCHDHTRSLCSRLCKRPHCLLHKLLAKSPYMCELSDNCIRSFWWQSPVCA